MPKASKNDRPHDHGFTLIELLIVIEVIGLLAMGVANQVQRAIAHARVAQCVIYEKALQNALWNYYAMEGDFPSDLESVVGHDIRPCLLGDEFAYAGGEDSNHGHGNDWDGHDGDNPGRSHEDVEDVAGFYLRCEHDHSRAGVLYVDCGSYLPPKVIHDEQEVRW